MKKILYVLSVLVLIVFSSVTTLAIEVPEPTSRVVDLARVLESKEIDSLVQKIGKIEKDSNGVEIGILIIPTLDDKTVAEFGTEVFQKWKIGKKDKDNGVLILLVTKDRKIRINVGYGLEEVITDGEALKIIDSMKSNLKKSEWVTGLNVGLDSIYSRVKSLSEPENVKKTGSKSGLIVPAIVILLIAIGFAYIFFKRRKGYDDTPVEKEVKWKPSLDRSTNYSSSVSSQRFNSTRVRGKNESSSSSSSVFGGSFSSDNYNSSSYSSSSSSSSSDFGGGSEGGGGSDSSF